MRRRDFIRTAGSAALAGVSLSVFSGSVFARSRKDAGGARLPTLDVSGAPFEMGVRIGRRFGPQIRTGMRLRHDWYRALHDYATGEGRANFDGMIRAAKEHTPQCIEEVKGWARGSGIPFEDLMVLNCKSELDSFMRAGCGCPGCTTVVLRDGGRLVLAHNEDGHAAYDDQTFMLRVAPDGEPRFVAMTYPGILSGMAPAVNEHGIALTTNYIPSRKVRPGIPRYFQMRRIMAADSIEEAVRTALHPARAFAFHHIIASLKDGRAISLEVNPDRHEQKEIKGLFFHTNHLLHPSMKDEPQFAGYINKSSIPRYESVQKTLGNVEDLSKIDAGSIITALSNHDGRPYSVCRHPEGDVNGSTLATGLFEYPLRHDMGMRLYKHNPCGERSEIYPVRRDG